MQASEQAHTHTPNRVSREQQNLQLVISCGLVGCGCDRDCTHQRAACSPRRYRQRRPCIPPPGSTARCGEQRRHAQLVGQAGRRPSRHRPASPSAPPLRRTPRRPRALAAPRHPQRRLLSGRHQPRQNPTPQWELALRRKHRLGRRQAAAAEVAVVDEVRCPRRGAPASCRHSQLLTAACWLWAIGLVARWLRAYGMHGRPARLVQPSGEVAMMATGRPEPAACSEAATARRWLTHRCRGRRAKRRDRRRRLTKRPHALPKGYRRAHPQKV